MLTDKLISVPYHSLPVHHDEMESSVIVEWVRSWGKDLDNQRLIRCFIPADAWRTEDGKVIICYERHPNGSYDPYFVKYCYDENNMPNLYKLYSIGAFQAIQISLGLLMGYDDKDDCYRPFLNHVDDKGKNVYDMWWDIPQLKDKWKIWSEC